MRVIAGTARSRPLAAPKGIGTRPTADRLKENLFNILQPELPGTRFLDLFGGSGAIGIEALSRGADRAVFVEKKPETAAILRANLTSTGLRARANVLTLPVADALRYLSKRREVFDMIFMDPPYKSALLRDTMARLECMALLNGCGLIIAEMPAEADAPVSERFKLKKTKIYGGAQFAFYRP